MLYCPQCGAEYREGYSSCSDCHVLLTREKPAVSNTFQESAPPEPGDPNKDPFTPFWRGDDSRLHAELCSVLDEVDVPHMTVCKEDRLFRMTAQPTFELAVPHSLMEKAESAVREAFGETPELPAPDAEELNNGPLIQSDRFVHNWARKGLLPALLEKLREPRPSAESTRDTPSKDPDEWFREDATIEVWSGQDETLAEMISASLLENDIHSRTGEFKDSQLLFVEPQDESRAREIVREIIEGTPPE